MIAGPSNSPLEPTTMNVRHTGKGSQRLPPWLRAAALCLATGLCSVQAQTPANCNPVRFQPGESSAAISGTVPAEDRLNPTEPLCYSLTVGNDQRAKVAVVSGPNIAISIPGQGDARDAFDFVTQRGTYELHVFPLFPSGEAEPFRIHVEVVDQ